MTHEISAAATSGPQMISLMRASPSLLLLATVMAIISFCQLIKHADAGGKGKVPVYMPIPIPIPMPMSPPHQHGKPQGFQHHHQQQQHEEGEGEISKIYLLQPMPHAKPQPNFKGGGFVGAPVQNNIHLGGGGGPAYISMSPGRHRHAGGGGGHNSGIVQKAFFEQQAPEQQMQHVAPQLPQVQQEQHKHVKSTSEVKILPIVVIPPIAPMPPVQLNQQPQQQQQQQQQQTAPRMTLSPQFNNYVLSASSHGRRRSSGGGGGGAGRHHVGGGRLDENFHEYGGSLGGSVFRERFARSRPMRARNFRSQLIGEASSDSSYGDSSSRPRDFDYGDYEPAHDDPGHWQRRHQRSSAPISMRRGGHSDSSAYYNQGRPSASRAHHEQQQQQQQPQQQRVKSIRDIIEQVSDDELTGAGTGEDYESSSGQQVRQPARSQSWSPSSSSSSPLQVNLQSDELAGDEMRARSRTASMEISLDDLSLLAADKSRRVSGDGIGAASTQHELSSLYYDRASDYPASSGSQQPQENSYLTAASRGARLARPRTSAGGRGSQYRLARGDERDLFDNEDDEWRFDTIKSVRHAAPNANMTISGVAADTTRGSAVQNGTLTVETHKESTATSPQSNSTSIELSQSFLNDREG